MLRTDLVLRVTAALRAGHHHPEDVIADSALHEWAREAAENPDRVELGRRENVERFVRVFIDPPTAFEVSEGSTKLWSALAGEDEAYDRSPFTELGRAMKATIERGRSD